MKRNNSIRYFALAALLFAGCTKYLDFEGEGARPRLVLNALMHADSTFEVHLSNSVGYVDNISIEDQVNGEVRVRNAQGDLIETLFHDGDGRYIGIQTAQAGMSYTIEAEHPGFAAVSSSDRVPAPVVIMAVDTFSVSSTDPYGSELNNLNISIAFNDPTSENYYSIEVFQNESFYVDYIYDPEQNAYVLDTIWLDSPSFFQMPMVTSDPVLLNETTTGIAETEVYGNRFLFSDALFNGSTRTITLRLENFASNSQYVVRLSSLSHDYFRYLRTVDSYLSADGDPFAEPVLVFSNVTNGLGIIGGISLFDYPIE
jgi:hypothetical protein